MKKIAIALLCVSLFVSPDIFAQQKYQFANNSSESVRPWRAPSFENQSTALGYNNDIFKTPKGMEKQVQFWVDIYTKYSSNQGVIHDSENVEVIYEVVQLDGLKTEREKQKKIDEAKKRIGTRLNRDGRERLRFQLGQKDLMLSGIFFSGRYIEDMEQIFKKAGLPIELTRLAFVESSFNIMAQSKVGASGIWQIMPYTARPYGMISPAVDKRNHPLEATKIAARLLRQNYGMLGAWPLAITGYNHGPTGVLKVTRNYKTRDLNELIQNVRSRKSFGFASRNFYASFLAALEVEKNASKYFKNVVWSQPLGAKELKLPVSARYKDVLSWFDGDERKARLFNPHLTLKARKGGAIPARTLISVPKDKYNIALISLARKGRSIAMDVKKDGR